MLDYTNLSIQRYKERQMKIYPIDKQLKNSRTQALKELLQDRKEEEMTIWQRIKARILYVFPYDIE